MLLLAQAAAAASCPEITPLDLAPPAAPDAPRGEVGEGEGALRVLVVNDEGAPLSGVTVLVVGVDGAVHEGETDDDGTLLMSGLPVGEHVLAAGGITVSGIRVAADRTRQQHIVLHDSPSLQAPAPGEPPGATTWVRYSRSGCLGPCETVDVAIERGELSSRRASRLQERLDCLRTLPSFSALQATDHVWTQLDVWEADGSSWSWVWYSGDFRAPREPLARVRRQLEGALGVGSGEI